MKKIIILILILIVIAAVKGWFIFAPPSSDATEKVFVIAKGERVSEISQRLKEQNFIKNEFIFECYAWLQNLGSKFQAGEYKLRQNMSLAEIVKILTSGKSVEERDIKIIEGWNNREIADYLEKEGVIDKDDFLKITMNQESEIANYEFLKDRPEGATLEGYLFPDTYRIYKEIPQDLRGEKDAETALADHIIGKMLDNFDKKLTAGLREEIVRQKKTIFEIVTIASILEKEVKSDEDRAMVADIFWRRLEAGMPLQADSTVNYVTGKSNVRASVDDLQIDSPYNTYKYKGLPKGPISNPGLGAIKAAIYPKSNDFWYFLTTDDGKVIYAKNFDEHKANKAKYLK
jgi:UPF0755 protein